MWCIVIMILTEGIVYITVISWFQRVAAWLERWTRGLRFDSSSTDRV